MSNKQLFFILAAFTIIGLYIIRFISITDQNKSNGQNMLTSTHPHKVIFLWDLHEVVFEKDIWNFLRVGWNHNRKLQTIFNLNSEILKVTFKYFLEKLHLSADAMTSEELIAAAKKANNQALVNLAIKVGCSYRPIHKTVSIINELTNLGYTHHIGSNIGATVYEAFKQLYPAIFGLFNAKHIIHYIEGQPVIKKPQPTYFTTYLEKHHLKPEQVVFIDDKYTNVKAAHSMGITTIHFKNPTQLRTTLQKLGFALAEQKNIATEAP